MSDTSESGTEPETQPTQRPFEPPPPTGEARTDALRNLLAVIDRLRAPDGCPWDLKQTLDSVAPHFIEEAHELVEAAEAADWEHCIEESGDLLMGLLLFARIAEQEQRFDLVRIAGGVTEKLIRRHPHVFGAANASDADSAVNQWEAIKRAERAAQGERDASADTSALAGVPVALPALQRAARLAGKARAAGFQWSDARGALAKVREEIDELDRAFEAAQAEQGGLEGAQRAALEHELGDVLMAAGILGSYLDIDPEKATRQALRRFEQRFRRVEALAGGTLEDLAVEQCMQLWERAKRGE